MKNKDVVEWLPVHADSNNVGVFYVTKADGSEVSVPAYPFQQTQQYLNNLPESLPCIIMEDGSVQQSVAELLRLCFGKRRKATFVVESRDGSNYTLADFFGFTHRYTDWENEFEVGQELEVEIKGIEEQENNRAWLELANAKDPNILKGFGVCASYSPPIPRAPRSVLGGGMSLGFLQAIPKSIKPDYDKPYINAPEGRKKEFKSSFVFTQNGQNNIDSQMKEIVQAIAAFMNAEGGKLYIGVRDNGDIRGLEQDLPYLNTSQFDTKKYYHQNFDGLKQKIQSSVKWHLGDNALDYIDTISTRAPKGRSDLHYVIVTVEPAHNDIIWFSSTGNGRNNELYVRRDGMVQHYPTGDAMTKFIVRRMKSVI